MVRPQWALQTTTFWHEIKKMATFEKIRQLCLIVPNPYRKSFIFSRSRHQAWCTLCTLWRLLGPSSLKIEKSASRPSTSWLSRGKWQAVIPLWSLISSIDFKHDHCKWKILGSVDGCQNFHLVSWSHLVNQKILLQSSARCRIGSTKRPYLH